MRCPHLLALLALMAALPAGAATRPSSSASIDLRIVVPRVMELKIEGHPSQLRVTDADVARGQVLVRGPRVRITANDRNGAVLRAQLRDPAFSGFEVGGLPATLACDCDEAQVALRIAGNRIATEVDYLLRLAAGTPPGSYSWPLTLSLQDP